MGVLNKFYFISMLPVDLQKKQFMFYYSVFYREYENEKKMGQKNLTFPDGDLNPGF